MGVGCRGVGILGKKKGGAYVRVALVRLIDLMYHSTLGLRVITKKKEEERT